MGDDGLIFSAVSVSGGQISVEPLQGTGSATFARTGLVAHVRDFDNVYRLVQANEARIQGARRVENLAIHSDDITEEWSVSNTATIDDFETVSLPAVNDSISYTPINSSISGEVYTIRLKLSGIGTTRLVVQDGATETDVNITLVSGGKVYSITHMGDGSSTIFRVRLQRASGQTATSVTVNNVQVENLSGASNTAPSEYIPTTTAAVAKYYTTTNGNSVASNVVVEAAGLPLHPTVSKSGANVLARYGIWDASASGFEVGFRRIPLTGSGTAGGNGFWYFVSAITTGTTGASEPTWPTTIGGTVVDGGVTWTNGGHYKLAGYLGEPAAENVMLHNRDWTDAVYTPTNITPLKDATGVDGVANSCSTLTADAGNGTIFQVITIASAAFNSSVHVKRKTGTGTIEFTDNGGTNYTDITALIDSSGFTVVDINRTQANPSVGFRIVTSGDEIEVDMGGLIAGSVPSSPIITTTVAVTRNADVLYYEDAGNIEDAAGTLLCSVRSDDWDALANDSRVIGKGISIPLYYSTGRYKGYDGTNGVNGAADANMTGRVSIQGGNRWSGAEQQPVSSGATTTAGAYDGAWSAGNLYVLNHNGSSNFLQGTISDIRIYKKDLGTAKCESHTEYD
jgi:hypothetical protein